jgi:ABC-type multidrug transport system fused ATPase/permease subunit
MDDLLQNLKIKQEAESAQDEANSAWKKFDIAQINHKKEVINIFEKMSLYSAGIISLSITFVGYILSENKSVFLVDFINIPIYIFLYISWGVLTVNLIIGLIIRWADSLYLFFNYQHFFHKKRKESEEKKLELLNNYSNMIFSADSGRNEEIKICKTNIETLNEHLIKKTKNKEEFYLKSVKWLQRISITMFIAGIIFLLAFVINATNSLIYL